MNSENGWTYEGSNLPPVPGVPELRKRAEEPPADLRGLFAGQIREIMAAKGMGGPVYGFEFSGCLIPDPSQGAIVGGWILILSRKTGLVGQDSILCAPGTMPTGYPSKDQLGILIDQCKASLDELQREITPGLNGGKHARP